MIPRASRSRLSCEPSSIRRTTDPGSPALTYVASPTIRKYLSLPLKHFKQYSYGYGNGKR
ncbi:hypothetical protein GCM10017776_26010 [Streptomyces griseoluteus]|nr:hypothetical protein GCM10017776_26010 [Streptomyces griseoluteus]